jgi:hypothetical protein
MMDYIAYLHTQARMRDQFTPARAERREPASPASARRPTAVALKHSLAVTLRAAADRLEGAPPNLQPA